MRLSPVPAIEIASSNWYNPYMQYQTFMVPGIMAILVTLIGMYLTALNIVKEKEIGTIEQINVTPIKKYQFILGKLIPFWILGNVIFTIGMLVAWRVYGIIPLGSIGLLYGYLAVFLLAVLGLGLLLVFCPPRLLFVATGIRNNVFYPVSQAPDSSTEG